VLGKALAANPTLKMACSHAHSPTARGGPWRCVAAMLQGKGACARRGHSSQAQLDLSSYVIGDAGAAELAMALMSNCTLATVW